MGTKIAILGSGAMGTACSVLLSEHSGQDVSLWGWNDEHIRELMAHRENRRLLPGIRVPDRVTITTDVSVAVRDAELIVAAIPTKFLRSALNFVAPHIPADRPFVSVIKGLEVDTFLRPSEIIADVLGSRAIAAMCGPSHAEEIARRLPASVVSASGDLTLARRVQEVFSTDRFRVYTNPDIIGVELAGALKNVIAIAAGICDGLGYGDNAKSALLTRGIVEMTRFGTALGAEASTFPGLAGMGDLITTCFSRHSRNRLVGERLGKGETLEQILRTMDAVAEGVTTAQSIHDLAEDRDIEMPITQQVFQVLFDGKNPAEATSALMLRPPRGE
jgi:glycerol-3-phosphate dehydrogenase (NAD(P)+)